MPALSKQRDHPLISKNEKRFDAKKYYNAQRFDFSDNTDFLKFSERVNKHRQKRRDAHKLYGDNLPVKKKTKKIRSYNSLIDDDIEKQLDNGNSKVGELKWERPRVSLDSYVSDSNVPEKKRRHEKDYPLSFMMTDVTYDMAGNEGIPHIYGQIPKEKHKKVPTIIATGVNEKGETVTANIHGFMPYFYCDSGVLCRLYERRKDFKRKEFQEAIDFWCKTIHKRLEACIEHNASKRSKQQQQQNDGPGDRVYRVSVVHKKPLYAIQLKPRPLFKIEMCQPFDVPAARSAFWEKQLLRDVQYGACYQTYEPNVEFVIRWMIDSHVTGCGWMCAEPDKAHVIHHYRDNPCKEEENKYTGKRTHGRMTTSDIEYHVHWEDLYNLDAEENPRWGRVAPFVILSYDIEVKAARIGEFPTAEKSACQIIDIGCLVHVYGQKERHKLITFCLGDSDPPKTPERDATKDTLVPDPEVYSFDAEEDLLMAWAKFKKDMQIDMTTGYNTYGFDTKYVYDRAKHLGIDKEFGQMTTKLPNRRVVLKKAGFTNKQKGSNQFELPTVFGDIEIDTLKCATADIFLKLRSYKLDNVAKEVLGRQKIDVHYTEINGLHEKDSSTRKRLVEYVNEDAVLPLEILENKGYLPALIEQSRVCHVPLQWMITKGQQVRNIAAFLPFCIIEDFILPYIKEPYDPNKKIDESDDEGYQGATVLEPKKGYYDECVMVLDFASLYPSIMQWKNLCYSTWIPHNSPLLDYLVEGVHYETGPTGHIFAKREFFHGVLPRALRDILKARSMAKKDMAIAKEKYGKNSPQYKKEDSRQGALKVTANSMYGLTGAVIGRLPCKPVAETVTAYGRLLIEVTKKFVEDLDPRYEVVYGDTDSVMVRIRGCKDVAKAIEEGEKLEKKLNNDLFENEIEIELENVYYPWILIGKKMYTGPFWTDTKKPLYIKSRGLTNVRRDNALFASKLYNSVVEAFFAWDQKADKGQGNLIDVEKDPETGEIIKHGWNRETMQMEGDNVQATIDLIHSRIKSLHAGEIPLNQLVITQSFGRPVERYKAKLPHIELVKRMRKRDPASAPKLGERVPYVVTKGMKKDNLCEHVEDPRYAEQHGIPIDYKYYDETQCRKPLMRLLTPVFAKKMNVKYDPMELDEDEYEKEDGMDIDECGGGGSSNGKSSWLKRVKRDSEKLKNAEGSNSFWNKMMNSTERAPDPHVIAYRKLFPHITKKKVKGPSETSAFSLFRKDVQKKRGINCIDAFAPKDRDKWDAFVDEKKRRKIMEQDEDKMFSFVEEEEKDKEYYNDDMTNNEREEYFKNIREMLGV